MSVCLSVCLSVSVCLCLSVYLSVFALFRRRSASPPSSRSNRSSGGHDLYTPRAHPASRGKQCAEATRPTPTTTTQPQATPCRQPRSRTLAPKPGCLCPPRSRTPEPKPRCLCPPPSPAGVCHVPKRDPTDPDAPQEPSRDPTDHAASLMLPSASSALPPTNLGMIDRPKHIQMTYLHQKALHLKVCK